MSTVCRSDLTSSSCTGLIAQNLAQKMVEVKSRVLRVASTQPTALLQHPGVPALLTPAAADTSSMMMGP